MYLLLPEIMLGIRCLVFGTGAWELVPDFRLNLSHCTGWSPCWWCLLQDDPCLLQSRCLRAGWRQLSSSLIRGPHCTRRASAHSFTAFNPIWAPACMPEDPPDQAAVPSLPTLCSYRGLESAVKGMRPGWARGTSGTILHNHLLLHPAATAAHNKISLFTAATLISTKLLSPKTIRLDPHCHMQSKMKDLFFRHPQLLKLWSVCPPLRLYSWRALE